MSWIKETYGKGKTTFLHPGDGPLTLDGVADARVYILGPPEDEGLIKRYNPSASGAEVYPKAMAAAIEAAFFAALGVVPTNRGPLPDTDAIAEAQRMSLPFDEKYQIKAENAHEDSFFKEYYYGSKKAMEWRRIEGAWLDSAGEFALQLDSATNKTSLAFALEIGPPGEGKVLLFPGDAQVGNWQSWFGKVPVGKKQFLGKDMVWNVAGKKVTAEDLLRRTVLYKVGRHGSHNATLRAQGLELMGRPDGTAEFVALLPVDEHVARDLAHYGDLILFRSTGSTTSREECQGKHRLLALLLVGETATAGIHKGEGARSCSPPSDQMSRRGFELESEIACLYKNANHLSFQQNQVAKPAPTASFSLPAG